MAPFFELRVSILLPTSDAWRAAIAHPTKQFVRNALCELEVEQRRSPCWCGLASASREHVVAETVCIVIEVVCCTCVAGGKRRRGSSGMLRLDCAI